MLQTQNRFYMTWTYPNFTERYWMTKQKPDGWYPSDLRAEALCFQTLKHF